MKKYALYIGLLLIFSSQVLAQDMAAFDTTGNGLFRASLSALKNAEGKELSANEHIELIFYTGYVTGFDDSAVVTHMGSINPFYISPTEGMTSLQVFLIVRDYLLKHPEYMNETARMCLLLALTDAFPNKNKK